MTNDKLEALDKQLRQLRKEMEDDLLKYKDKGWLDNVDLSRCIISPERCSCGARDKAKCSKESFSGGGKMCVKGLKEEKRDEAKSNE